MQDKYWRAVLQWQFTVKAISIKNKVDQDSGQPTVMVGMINTDIAPCLLLFGRDCLCKKCDIDGYYSERRRITMVRAVKNIAPGGGLVLRVLRGLPHVRVRRMQYHAYVILSSIGKFWIKCTYVHAAELPVHCSSTEIIRHHPNLSTSCHPSIDV